MANIAGPSSFSSSSSYSPNSLVDIIELFNVSARRDAMGASSSSSSSLSAPRQITLASVSYNVDLSINKDGESELWFEANTAMNRSPSPESWKFCGSADAVAHSLCCCFSADSKYLITAGYASDFNIRLWNPSTRNLVTTLAGHTSNVYAVVSFDLKGKVMVASASDDTTIRIWELKDTASSSLCITTLQTSSFLPSLAFSPKHHLLISGQYDGTIMFWSPSNWQCIQTLSVSPSSQVSALSLSSDESKLASGHQDGSIHIWDMASCTEIKTWKAATKCITLNGLCFSPTQPNVLAAASNDGTCTTWNCATVSKVGSIASQFAATMTPSLFSSNGKYYVTVSKSNQLILVDSVTHSVIKPMDNSSSIKNISAACFSPDNKYLACVTRQSSKSLHIWESTLPVIHISSTIIPQSTASDFRLLSLSDNVCLVVARLSSGEHAVTIAEPRPSSSGQIIFNQWIFIPKSLQHSCARFITSGGKALKIDFNIPSQPAAAAAAPPLFNHHGPLSEAFSSITRLLEEKEADKEVLRKEVAALTRDLAKTKEEACAQVMSARQEFARQVAVVEEKYAHRMMDAEAEAARRLKAAEEALARALLADRARQEALEEAIQQKGEALAEANRAKDDANQEKEEAARLREALSRAREALKRARDEAKQAAKEEALKDLSTWLNSDGPAAKRKREDECPICMDSQRDVALSPCGHTVCQQCAPPIQNCPTCSGAVESKLRFYLDREQ